MTPLNLHLPRSLLLGLSLIFLSHCQTGVTPDQPETVAAPIIANKRPAETLPATTSSNTQASADSTVQADNLWERLAQGFQLQESYEHPAVKAFIQRYSNNQRLFDLVAQRASPFLFDIVNEVDRRELPLELALLPIVESTFDPNAYSQEHAVGLWQILGSTASSLGLQQDWWYDGRRDPISSTHAALDYLESLHKQFSENWLVALGAYNTGDGNVRRAIRRSGQSMSALNFWDLPLAPETRSHVPKLLALAAVISNIQSTDLELPPMPNHAQVVSVEINSQIDFSHAATLAGIDDEELKRLNPGYLQWATHPDTPQSLIIPVTKAALFETNLAQADRTNFVTWDRIEIKAGDTLGQLARNLGTRVDILQQVNNIKGSRIVAGESLLIPRNLDSLETLSSVPNKPASSTPLLRTIPASYTVRRGDNLWSIARKFKLRSTEIASYNGFELNSILRPGQSIDLSYAASTGNNVVSDTASNHPLSTHLVKQGDSIAKIAKLSGRRTEDLLDWNSLKNGELIFPGQQIRLTPPDSGTN